MHIEENASDRDTRCCYRMESKLFIIESAELAKKVFKNMEKSWTFDFLDNQFVYFRYF